MATSAITASSGSPTGEAHDCWTTTEAALTRDLSEDLQDAYERLRETAVEFGEQRIYASHSSIMFARKSCYFFVRPKRSYLEVVVFLGRAVKSPRIKKVVESSKTKRAHIIQVRHRDEVEAPLTEWLQEAYALQSQPPQPSATTSKKRKARRVCSTEAQSGGGETREATQEISRGHVSCIPFNERGTHMSTDYVVYGLYPDRESFERGIESLRAASFRNSDISAIFPERDRTTKDLAHEINTKAPEGAAAGAAGGAAVGGVLGWLIGVGMLAIPGVGPLMAAGPIVAALAGAGAAGATGGLVGAMVGAGIPEIEAKRYAGRIREGGYLVSVHCDDKDWAKRAEEILEATGGSKVVKTSEATADYRP